MIMTIYCSSSRLLLSPFHRENAKVLIRMLDKKENWENIYSIMLMMYLSINMVNYSFQVIWHWSGFVYLCLVVCHCQICRSLNLSLNITIGYILFDELLYQVERGCLIFRLFCGYIRSETSIPGQVCALLDICVNRKWFLLTKIMKRRSYGLQENST